MNNLSIVIMATRKREAWAKELSSKLNDCPIAFDPHDRFNVSNIWENCKRAWSMQDKSKKWSLVIQDDAILCKNFVERATEHLNRAEESNSAIQFYLGNSYHLEQQFKANKKKGFLIKEALFWGVAIAMKTELIPKMIAFGNARAEWQDDTKIKYFLLKNKITTYYPIPGLIDHRRREDNPSTVGSEGRDRFSNFFIDNI
jgi:hypothetical protein